MHPTQPPRLPVAAKAKAGLLVLITLLLILVTTVAVATGEESGQGSGGDLTSEATELQATELPAKRTASSYTFALSDGTRQTVLYAVPVNYRDGEGDWVPIEQDLEEAPGDALTNGGNSFDVHLPEDLGEGAVRVDFGEEWISEKPIGIETEPADLQSGDVASYATEEGEASFEFLGLSNGLKETINLAGPSAPATYHFRLEASAGVAPGLTENGSVEFREGEGNVVAEMPAPVMNDDAGVPAPADSITYGLEPEGGGWRLTVEADPQWLQEPERSWPVVIDPSMTEPILSSRDCLISTVDFSSLCGNKGWSYMVAKANYPSTGSDSFARTLLRFELKASKPKEADPIPETASLTNATIRLYSAKTATNITKVDLYDVSRSWTDSATWLNYSGSSNKWATPGGEFGKHMPIPTSLTPAERGGSEKGWWSFSGPQLVNLVERWRAEGPVDNTGVLVKLADESPRVCCIERRVEWESSAGTNKPYLSAQYILPASPDSEVTSPSDGTKTAKRLLLTSAWDHSGVNGVTFQYKDGYRWADIPQSQVIDGNNQTVTWPYSVPKVGDRKSRPLYWDASSLTGANPSAKVQIRAVLAGDPGATGYTKPVTAEIDKNVGGPKDGVASTGPGSVNLLTGNLTVSRTDVSIPAFNSALEFSRSFNSRESGVEATGVLGPGWKPAAPLEEAGGSGWTKVKLEQESEEYEGETFTYKWATLTHSEGGELAFEENEGGQFITPEEMSGYVLYRNPETGTIEFTDPDGNRTVFSNGGSGSEYLPISVVMTGGPGNKSRMFYEPVGGKRRLKMVIAPTAPGQSCPDDESATTTNGCRVLNFTYKNAKEWDAPESAGSRLQKITYYAPGFGGPWEVAKYDYDTNGRLAAAWDPRISPAIKETYTYTGAGPLSTITEGGFKPWTMEYGTISGDSGVGRLIAVKRPTLVESKPTAQTTIAYGVPLNEESGGAYDMEAEHVATWGQEDLPTDATAIFPPDEVPSSPPSVYTRATVYYMDAEGQTTNVATPSGAGTSAPSITTTETNEFGNVVRELTAQNRLRALAAGKEASAAKSQEIDTQFRYSADGTELQEEVGPMHQVRLNSGTTTQARLHRSIQYDANFKYINGTTTPSPGEGKPHLPTTETTG
ncbi:MAG TPA: DNRLRE domain-containing protein, partial [Solirubrobacterales bacterium]